MSEWQWFWDSEQDARARGDRERLRLPEIHRQAYDLRETDPDRMLLLMEDGRRLAQQLSEPWWVLLFDHWKVTTLVYHKRDYRNVIEMGLRNLLEVRKPQNVQFPQRLRICSDLIAAYLGVDPLGYADEITEALTYLATEVTPEMDSSPYLLEECRWCLAFEQERFDEALELALACLARADADPDRYTARHHSLTMYIFLCMLAHQRKDGSRLREWATAGEELARQLRYLHPLARFMLWQGVAAQQAGDQAQGGRLCHNAVSRMTRLGKPPSEDYFLALSSFHELRGNLDDALQVREQELRQIMGTGRLAYECEIRIECCRLRSRLGVLQPSELAAARESAARLRRPAKALAEIERIEEGKPPKEA
jgi:hypothetical protein